MLELIQQYTVEVRDGNGIMYSVCAYGERRADGAWEGIIEFCPINAEQPTLRTERETTQPDRAALVYWASGLEPLYFDGAFNRAMSLREKRKLQSIESYILDLFDRSGQDRMPANEILKNTHYYDREDLLKAVDDLERKKRLLVRYRYNNDDWVQLTPEGARYDVR